MFVVLLILCVFLCSCLQEEQWLQQQQQATAVMVTLHSPAKNSSMHSYTLRVLASLRYKQIVVAALSLDRVFSLPSLWCGCLLRTDDSREALSAIAQSMTHTTTTSWLEAVTPPALPLAHSFRPQQVNAITQSIYMHLSQLLFLSFCIHPSFTITNSNNRWIIFFLPPLPSNEWTNKCTHFRVTGLSSPQHSSSLPSLSPL